ncbi:hypothetical protein HDK77DRAFT_16274 [Phyllosticta capitalensis]
MLSPIGPPKKQGSSQPSGERRDSAHDSSRDLTEEELDGEPLRRPLSDLGITFPIWGPVYRRYPAQSMWEQPSLNRRETNGSQIPNRTLGSSMNFEPAPQALETASSPEGEEDGSEETLRPQSERACCDFCRDFPFCEGLASEDGDAPGEKTPRPQPARLPGLNPTSAAFMPSGMTAAATALAPSNPTGEGSSSAVPRYRHPHARGDPSPPSYRGGDAITSRFTRGGGEAGPSGHRSRRMPFTQHAPIRNDSAYSSLEAPAAQLPPVHNDSGYSSRGSPLAQITPGQSAPGNFAGPSGYNNPMATGRQPAQLNPNGGGAVYTAPGEGWPGPGGDADLIARRGRAPRLPPGLEGHIDPWLRSRVPAMHRMDPGCPPGFEHLVMPGNCGGPRTDFRRRRR